MEIDLTGRTALVTGSTSGIGRAIATGLAGSGADVIVHGRSAERTEAAASKIAAEASAEGRVRAVTGDLGTADGAQQVLDAEPDVDILVNNAGIFRPTPVFEITDEDWLEHFQVNVMSAIRLARHHVPRMVERGWGRVQFISSESALQITPEMVQYAMTKTAMLAVSRGMAESVPGTGVTVNVVMPGPTLTPGVEEMLREQIEGEGGPSNIDEAGAEFIASERPTSLLGRLIDPTEVANLCVYLASDLSSATTGAALRVDGGVLRAAIG